MSQNPPALAQISQLTALLDVILKTVPQWARPQIGFPTVQELKIDTEFTEDLADGRIVRIFDHGGFDLLKVSSGTVHFTSAAGAMFRLHTAIPNPMFFGAAGDAYLTDGASTNGGVVGTLDNAALDMALGTGAAVIDLGGRAYRYSGDFSAAIPQGTSVVNGVIYSQIEIFAFAAFDYRFVTARRIATPGEVAAPDVETSKKLVRHSDIVAIISAASPSRHRPVLQ